MGKFNNPGPDGNPHILSVGNGTASNARSNSLAINSDGKVIIGKATKPLGEALVDPVELSDLLEILDSLGIITFNAQ